MSRQQCILGIDPGISGAIAFYFPDHPERVAVEDMPDMPIAAGEVGAISFANQIRAMAPDVAILDAVHAMPKQGVSSVFKFGRAFGTVIGVIGAAAIPLYLVTPQKWKKHFHLKADKDESRALALRMFPSVADSFKRKKDDGRAEAALIARYGAETLQLVGSSS